MATFAEIQAKVRTRLIDLPTAVSDEVPGLVNAALRDLTSKHTFLVQEKLLSATTTADTRVLVARPSDWKEPRAKPYWVPFGVARARRIFWAPHRTALESNYRQTDAGFPQYLLMGESTNAAGDQSIEVWPLPDGMSDWVDGEYRVRIPYVAFPAALSGNSDTNWFTNNAEEFLVARAAEEGFAIDWDEQRMAVWAQKAAVARDKVVMLDKRARLGSFDTLVPHTGGALEPELEG